MDEPIASSDDHPPGDFRELFTNRHRNMTGGFANQFQITQSGVVGQSTVYESCLVKAFSVSESLLGKGDHVIQIEAPLTPASFRH